MILAFGLRRQQRRTHGVGGGGGGGWLAGTVADLMASMYVMKYERRKCIKHEIAEMKCEHHLLYWLSAVQPI